MDLTDDSPQIGSADVDRDALGERGITLLDLAAELGAKLADSSASGAPGDGWRVLRRHRTGAVLIGAPVESPAGEWRLAHVGADPGSVVFVQPGSMPVRPSRAVRRAGLELRWPVSAASARGDFVVDIVNTGAARWESDTDGFSVVGVFTDPGVTGFGFGWADSSQYGPVPLDPGEYARVRVSIPAGSWNTLQAGTYDLHAVLVSVGLRTGQPLSVELTEDVIAQKRALRPSVSPAERRQMLDQQIEQARAQAIASCSLDRIADVIMSASTDGEAIAAIGHVLGVDDRRATAIYHSPLQDLSPRNARGDRHLEELKAQRERVH